MSSLGISVLAVLNEGPTHPYEMLQKLRRRHDDRIVRVRPGSLYHVVEWLRTRNLVEVVATGRAGNRPERTAYRITSAGDAALRARIRELIGCPAAETSPLLVALAESHNLFRVGVLDALRQRAEALEAQLAELDGLIDTARAEGSGEAHWLSLDYLRVLTAAELEWARGLSSRIDSGEVAWPQA
ncbi:MAG TPA: PadR family transcriptional regulator [Segeticoccus sp.]|nr:PadR family transcriptional regulator [Segeticoccus sp.]